MISRREGIRIGPDESLIPEGSTTAEPAGFGCAVALDPSGWAVVGSCTAGYRRVSPTGHSQVWAEAGAAWWIHLSSGRAYQRHVSPHPTAGGRFGASAAASLSHVLVGEPSGAGNPGGGAVHVYEVAADLDRRELRHVRSIAIPRPGAQHARFGASMALLPDASRVAIAASGADTYSCPPLCDAGAAFIFEVSTGRLIGKLLPLNLATGGGALGCVGFGTSIATSSVTLGVGDDGSSPATIPTGGVGAAGYILVGAPKASPPCADATGAGSAFLYDAGSLVQLAQLRPAGRSAVGMEFGASVGILHRDAVGADAAQNGRWWDDRRPQLLIGAPGLRIGGGETGLGAMYSAVLNLSRTAPAAIQPLSLYGLWLRAELRAALGFACWARGG